MPQDNVQLISHTLGDNCITLSIGGNRVEYYFNDPGQFHQLLRATRTWLEREWGNFTVKQLTERADEIRSPRGVSRSLSPSSPPPWIKYKSIEQGKEVDTMSDHQSKPSEEYSWTVIATVAQGITYRGGRKWFKTQEDAKTFASEIFEMEKNRSSAFDLAIVQCNDVVKPKPQIELVSTFKKSESGT